MAKYINGQFIQFTEGDSVLVNSGVHKGCEGIMINPYTRIGDDGIITRIEITSSHQLGRRIGVYQHRLTLITAADLNPNLEFKRQKMRGGHYVRNKS